MENKEFKVTVRTPVQIGTLVYFMNGTQVKQGKFVGFDYWDDGSILLHVVTFDNQLFNCTPDNIFDTKDELKDKLLEVLLEGENIGRP